MTISGGAGEELSEYLREIAQHSLLTPREEFELTRQMLEGGRAERAQARQRLIESTYGWWCRSLDVTAATG